MLNVTYQIMLEGKNEKEAAKWTATLERPPANWIGRRRGSIRSRVDPSLLDMMSGGGA